MNEIQLIQTIWLRISARKAPAAVIEPKSTRTATSETSCTP